MQLDETDYINHIIIKISKKYQIFNEGIMLLKYREKPAFKFA